MLHMMVSKSANEISRGQGKWTLSFYEPENREIILQPTWPMVYAYLYQVDGIHLSQLSLDLEGTGSLCLGGGNVTDEFDDPRLDRDVRHFCLIYFDDPPDGVGVTLIRRDHLFDPDEEGYMCLNITCGTDIPLYMCVPLPEVLEAFRYFFHTGRRSPHLSWED
ncbi:immunity protein Imm1 of predicted polymorphic toxin system [Melghirimyces profundicolus]|uniref:Immunity protein Imm1 of predicted polymorphic toxin system n=1 Tax=Melghirimyces profundicolus TaxID=1242148 RepID=A0A2T6C903_9BACL|nr:Imm1 family immunity protein [Melghirimyces profundicolus]PTX64792.1 immunity protein Imm1 of predicted polymorphic toxin system [Melghirimyces profundicolus]